MATTAKQSLREIANERMTIIQAYNESAEHVPDFEYGSIKIHCPFGHLYHADGGTSKAFKIYPGTNSAWCFAGCGYFTPVKLLAWLKGVEEDEAAEIILDMTNYVAPDIDSRWNALVDTPPSVDTDALADALKVACQRMAKDWEMLQFDEVVSVKLRQCLGLLSKVATDEDATKWLNATKEIMRKVLGES